MSASPCEVIDVPFIFTSVEVPLAVEFIVSVLPVWSNDIFVPASNVNVLTPLIVASVPSSPSFPSFPSCPSVTVAVVVPFLSVIVIVAVLPLFVTVAVGL